MMKEAKPFVIDNTLIYKAYLKVKENKGSAGVDSVSIEDYEKDLGNPSTSCGTDDKPRAISSSLEYCRGAKEEDPKVQPNELGFLHAVQFIIDAIDQYGICLCLRGA